MTLLVAVNLGDCAIIAADKKEIFILDDIITPLNEDADKIVNTGIGLMTGSGYVDLLNKVKTTVAESAINHTDQILSCILKERATIQESIILNKRQKSELLNKTGWLFSYCTTVNNNPTLRIALYHPSISEVSFNIIRNDTTKIIFPSDIDSNHANTYTDFMTSNMKSLEDGEFQDIISHNVNLVLELMNTISKISETVSNKCDIGLVFSNNDMKIANTVNINSAHINFIPTHS